jgi:hypothetical protein
MSTTDETTTTGGTGGGPSSRKRPPWQRAAKRYGPIVAIVALIGGAVVVFGGGGGGGDDGGDDDTASGDPLEVTPEELIRSGPMTPQKAELEGESDVDYGPDCDPETGRIRLPTIYAAPCVVPFEGDNGGATAQGVTADAVKVIAYQPDPAVDPIGSSLIAGAGADVDPEANRQTMQGYVDVFNAVFETYGRELQLEFFTGTGANDDVEAAMADAIAIAEQQPFAVLGGPLQAQAAFTTEIAAEGIISVPVQPLPESLVAENYPYVWGVTTPTQAAMLASEAIGNLAGPGPAEMAGDPALQAQDRRYAIVHYDTADGDHQEAFEALRDGLSEQGIELATDIEYVLDVARMQESARTMIAQLEDAGVTTVIFYGDFLMPQSLTAEATAQDFFPEWILGPNLLADTALFARGFDQSQWGNGFALGYAGTPGSTETGTAYTIYTWAYAEEPPSNIYAILEPGLREVFGGIHLAGADLTPETFRDGMLRNPPSGEGPTRPQTSRGNYGVWPTFDYGSTDSVTLMWWDPEARSVDEVGNEDLGSYRFANGGQRYLLGELPTSLEEAGLFDVGSSVVEYDELPTEDRPPDYPPPDL